MKTTLPASIKRVQGFTLIELLVAIAVVGVLSAAVLVAINPAQKINQANDSKAKSDVGQIASAEQNYFPNNSGSYTLAIADLVTASELSIAPSAPAGYTYTYTAYQASGGTLACTTAAKNCGAFSMFSTLKAPVTAGNGWCYRSATATAAESTAAACVP